MPAHPGPENPDSSMHTCCRPIYGDASAQLQVQASALNHVRPVTAASTCEPLISQVAKNGGGLRSLLQRQRAPFMASMPPCISLSHNICRALPPPLPSPPPPGIDVQINIARYPFLNKYRRCRRRLQLASSRRNILEVAACNGSRRRHLGPCSINSQ